MSADVYYEIHPTGRNLVLIKSTNCPYVIDRRSYLARKIKGETMSLEVTAIAPDAEDWAKKYHVSIGSYVTVCSRDFVEVHKTVIGIQYVCPCGKVISVIGHSNQAKASGDITLKL